MLALLNDRSKMHFLVIYTHKTGFNQNIQVLRNYTPCQLVNSYWCFGRAWSLRLQVQAVLGLLEAEDADNTILKYLYLYTISQSTCNILKDHQPCCKNLRCRHFNQFLEREKTLVKLVFSKQRLAAKTGVGAQKKNFLSYSCLCEFLRFVENWLSIVV